MIFAVGICFIINFIILLAFYICRSELEFVLNARIKEEILEGIIKVIIPAFVIISSIMEILILCMIIYSAINAIYLSFIFNIVLFIINIIYSIIVVINFKKEDYYFICDNKALEIILTFTQWLCLIVSLLFIILEICFYN